MRLAAIQFKARETVPDGLVDLLPLVHQAAGADLIVVPEMALHGYAFTSREAVAAVAEPAEGGCCAELAALARQTQSWLVVGFPEADRDALYNSARVFDPSGRLAGVVRKNLLYEADETWATAGTERQLFQTDAGSFAVGICMDLNDDGFLAWVAEQAPAVLALPTNWVQDEGSVWNYWRFRLHRGWPEGWVDLPDADPDRAAVDSVLVCANSYGPEGSLVLSGESAILDRRQIYAATGPTGDAVLLADLQQNRP